MKTTIVTGISSFHAFLSQTTMPANKHRKSAINSSVYLNSMKSYKMTPKM